MAFLTGTRHLSCVPLRWQSSAEYAYEEETGTYQLSRTVTFETTVKDDADLLVGRERHLGGLPLSLTVRQGTPDEYGDTSQRQTKYPDTDWPARTVITRAIGDCSYWPASKDGPECLFANIYVENWMLDDLWSAVRAPGLSFPYMSLEIFGNHLEAQEEVFLTYRWNADRDRGGGDLLIAAFHYATKREAAQP